MLEQITKLLFAKPIMFGPGESDPQNVKESSPGQVLHAGVGCIGLAKLAVRQGVHVRVFRKIGMGKRWVKN